MSIKWVEIIVTDKAQFRKALGDGVYTLLEQAETPVKIVIPLSKATLYFPGGVSVRKLRELCNALRIGT